MTNLKNVKLEIIVGDPWSFCEKFGAGPFFAQILEIEQVSEGHMLLSFDKPFESNGQFYKYFVASVRYVDSSLKELAEGGEVHFNFIWQKEELTATNKCFDTSWWRGGGVTFIGSAKKVE